MTRVAQAINVPREHDGEVQIVRAWFFTHATVATTFEIGVGDLFVRVRVGSHQWQQPYQMSFSVFDVGCELAFSDDENAVVAYFKVPIDT